MPEAAEQGVGQDGVLRAELADLGHVIARVRAELAALEADNPRGRHIPAATDELDAIVAHTAAATDAILEACEMIDDTARSLEPAGAEAVQAATARIYEACSFQDIVGQRTSKVVATLRMIDGKVAHLMAILGDPSGSQAPAMLRQAEDPALSYEAKMLLNGPQLAAAAMAQSEVDRLLSGLG
jgi:chemotaxis protein CheZ